MIPIYDSADILSGYSVSFTSNGKPKGYVILNSSSKCIEDPVVAFSLDGSDIYSTITNEYKHLDNSSYNKLPKCLYSSNPIEYGIEIKNAGNTYIYNENNTLVTKDNYKARSKYSSTNNVTSAKFMDSFVGHEGRPKGKIATQYDIKGASGFTPLVMGNMPSYKNDNSTAGSYGEGNCGPTCLTNICKFFYEKRGLTRLRDTAKDSLYGIALTKRWWYTYQRLAGYVEYHATGRNSGTDFSKMGPALCTYATRRGYHTFVGNNIGSDWTQYTRIMRYLDYPIMMCVSGWGEGFHNHCGHCIIAVGYLRLSNGKRFVRIVDEWHPTDYMYCLLQTGSGFTDISGFPVNIYK